MIETSPRQNARLLGPPNHIRVKIIRIPGSRISPGNRDRLHPMFRTLDPRNPCVRDGSTLTAIQVT